MKLFELLVLLRDKSKDKGCGNRQGKLKENEILTEGEYRLKCFGAPYAEISQLDITAVSCDSRRAQAGCVFVAIRGEKHDGNDFIPDAERRGIRVFVSEKETLKIKYGALIISKNTRKSLAEIAKLVYGKPDEKMTLVGITGTKGKSTLASLLRDLLDMSGIRCMMLGTLGVKGLTGTVPDFLNTTPTADIVYALLKKGSDEGIKTAIIEVSSQALETYRVHGIIFDYVAFTSLSRDHIGAGEHSSYQSYIAAKRRLFKDYHASCCIVNFDDAYSAYFSAGIKRVLRIGTSRFSDFKISDIRCGFDGMEFKLSGVPVKTRLVGAYNAENLSMAMVICSEISKLPVKQLAKYTEPLYVKGRFEHYFSEGRHIIIDYAHNEKSFSELISLVRNLTRGRIFAVFGAVGGRSYERRRALAECAEELADFSVITNDNPCFEEPYKIAAEIHSFFREKERARIVVNREEAIKYALSLAGVGDAVLLLGKGHEEYMLVKGEKRHFSERDIILRES